MKVMNRREKNKIYIQFPSNRLVIKATKFNRIIDKFDKNFIYLTRIILIVQRAYLGPYEFKI